MKYPLFRHYYQKGFLWFRIKGYGLFIKNFHLHPLLFSERPPLSKGFKINKYHISILKP